MKTKLELHEYIEYYGDQRAKLSRSLLKGRTEEASKARQELAEIRTLLEVEFGLSVY